MYDDLTFLLRRNLINNSSIIEISDDSDNNDDFNEDLDDDDDDSDKDLTFDDVKNVIEKGNKCEETVKILKVEKLIERKEASKEVRNKERKENELQKLEQPGKSSINAPLMPPSSKSYKKKKDQNEIFEDIIIKRSSEALKSIENISNDLLAVHGTSNDDSKDNDDCYILSIEEALMNVQQNLWLECVNGITAILQQYSHK